MRGSLYGEVLEGEGVLVLRVDRSPGWTIGGGEQGLCQSGCSFGAGVDPVPVQGHAGRPICSDENRGVVYENNAQTFTYHSQVFV